MKFLQTLSFFMCCILIANVFFLKNQQLSLNKTPDSGERDVKIKTSGDRNRQKLNGLHGIASSNSPLVCLLHVYETPYALHDNFK